MRRKTQLITQYARMWPREVFDCHVQEGNRKRPLVKAKGLELLERPGVYVLYRSDIPYYVGQADKLRRRLWKHANRPGSRYYNFWNFFSAFVVEDGRHRNEVEGILIAAMPTANSAKPRLKTAKYPKPVVDLIRRIRQKRANPVPFKRQT